MVTHILSPQLFHVPVILAIAFPLSLLVWKLKRFGSKRDSSSLDLGSKGDPTDEMEEVIASGSWWEYEVFLSFRGFDTRKKFVSHLHQKLKDKGIHVFKDDEDLPPGYDISGILQVIEKSRIAIVVLSTNFAFSTFCLDEIVKIIDCRGKKGQIVLPIFYELDPSDLEEHKGTIAKAFRKHKGKYDTTTIQLWRDALSAVAGIAGWESLKRVDGDEAKLINHICESVEERLTRTPSSTHRGDLVYMDFHMSEIDKRLNVACNEKRIIGIWGPGGIGKTTIAEEIGNRYAFQYESYCFLQNVKADYEEKGDAYLQKKLLDQALNDFKQGVRCRADGCKLICQRLHLKKVLLILDDVDDFEQLTALAGSLDWFGDRSRVIITTRNMQLLKRQGVQDLYKVQFLKRDKARKLFKIHAFEQNQSQEGYGDLINDFVTCAGGLPLALVVLGESLRGWDINEWQSELNQLKSSGYPKINKVLRRSYDRLDKDMVKDIFLDVAFFFIGWNKDRVIDILSRDDCWPLSAIRILEDKALLTIDKYNCLQMHDLIQDMARDIVKEESSLCEERSRLSGPRDVASMLRLRKETPKLEGVSLSAMPQIDQTIYLEANAFRKLYHLRILKFQMLVDRDKHVVRFHGDGLEYLPQELSYLHWDCFPFEHWPSTFSAENLVELRLPWNKLECLWIEDLKLEKLKVIDLSYSKRLKTFPNLSRAINIKAIHLCGCESLIEFASDFKRLEKVNHLTFRGCKGLDNLPLLPPNLTGLVLPKTAITKLSSDIESLMKLKDLSIGSYEELTFFPTKVDEITSLSEPTIEAASMKTLEFLQLSNSLGKLTWLTNLSLVGISITELPQSIEHLQELWLLELSWCTKLVRLSSNVHKLINLRRLQIEHCKCLCSLPQLPESLVLLTADFCEALKTLEGDGSWERLGSVSLIDCKGLDLSAYGNNLEHILMERIKTWNNNWLFFGDWIYPGKEIPRWFDYRSEGSSITIQLPSRPFLGVAFCVVFAVDQYSPDPDYLGWPDRISIKADTGHRKRNEAYISIQSEGVDDNILVWQEVRFGTGNADVKIRINFYACDVNDDPVEEVKVKRCGVHIFTTPDESNEDTYESEEEDVTGDGESCESDEEDVDAYESEEEDVTGDEESCESDEEDVAANKIAQDEIKRKMDQAWSSTNVKRLKRSH